MAWQTSPGFGGQSQVRFFRTVKAEIAIGDEKKEGLRTMTTAVCKAATILGVREELLSELLALINTTSGATPLKSTSYLSTEEREIMLGNLMNEYSRKL